MHKYEYTTSDGKFHALETMARYKEAQKIARCMAHQDGVAVTEFKQIF